MKSEEFRVLNEKLDQIMALLTPVPPKVQQFVADHDHEERMKVMKLERLHQKRKYAVLVPNLEELKEKERKQDTKFWEAMIDDGTITADEHALVQRVQERRDKESEQE